ncbi:hypothetical protein [Endozoicomonas atrinae]|uniref:hypothetical protein n=1 Tax=Endozoicomonas atrinae TaxID=1333660 RepID=UPI003AFFE824
MSKNTYAVAKNEKIKKKKRSLLKFQFSCILSLLLTLSLPCLPNTIKEEASYFSVSASYTTINEHEKGTVCRISSKDSIEKLTELKNTDCKLPLSDDPNDQSVILISHSPYHETKQILLTTRNLLMWAYMAVHVYKLLDSGNVLWSQKEACPCSGELRDISNKPERLMTKGFFFSYYLLTLGHHGWSYIQSYINPRQSNKTTHQPQGEELSWSDTISSLISKVSDSTYATQILTLALDSAALKWDCRCPGYLFYPDSFKDPSKAGHFYFNGHFWMLLLNVAIFTTDLAIDYL